MPALAHWILQHKRLVVGFWVAVTIAAFAAIGPAGKSLSQQFDVPGRELRRGEIAVQAGLVLRVPQR